MFKFKPLLKRLVKKIKNIGKAIIVNLASFPRVKKGPAKIGWDHIPRDTIKEIIDILFFFILLPKFSDLKFINNQAKNIKII